MSTTTSTIAQSTIAGLVALMKKVPAVVTAGQETEAENALQAMLQSVLTGTIVIYSADGAIDITASKGKINKGSAAALTLAAPNFEGQQLKLYSASAYAHVVTATGLIEDGVVGGAKTTLTFAAYKGASIELIGMDGHWAVLNKNAVTVS